MKQTMESTLTRLHLFLHVLLHLHVSHRIKAVFYANMLDENIFLLKNARDSIESCIDEQPYGMCRLAIKNME
jgi:hypothetical protein